MISNYKFGNNQIQQNIADEFSPSLINYKIEHHEQEEMNQYNPAEVVAMREERRRYEEEMKKQEQHNKNLKKYKENIKKYNLKQQNLHSEQIETDQTKLNKIQRSKEYNETLRKNMKIKNSKKEKNNNTKANLNQDNNHNNKDNHESNIVNSEVHQYTENHPPSEMCDTFSFKNTVPNNDNSDDQTETTKDISDKILFQITEHSKTSLNSSEINNESLQDKINQNVMMIKNFRKTGLLPMTSGCVPTNPSNYSNMLMETHSVQSEQSQYQPQRTPPVNHINTNTPIGELQQRRYKKALKKMMIEQLKNKSINIPSICSCGQLQRKIDSLLNENKSITPKDLMNVDCANNCIYYQKPGEYHKALSNIIQSIRNLKFDSYNK